MRNSYFTIVHLLAILTFLAGLIGMLFSLQFMWSARIEDLAGAGLAFVAGSVLVSGGLVSLVLLGRTNSTPLKENSL